MTTAQLRELDALPGTSVGAHTMSHSMLSALTLEQQRHELLASKQALEGLLGHAISLLSYPFGTTNDFSTKTAKLAEEAGYRAAFTVEEVPVFSFSRRFALPRLTIHDWPQEVFVTRLRRLFGEAPG